MQKFLDETPEAVAKFLRTTAGLSKSSIGEYLGDGDSFMINVMHAFIDSLDFKEQNFVNALRSLLQTFRLPGESQKVIHPIPFFLVTNAMVYLKNGILMIDRLID